MNNTLDSLRKQIDNVDEKIIELIGQRMKLVQEVGKVKRKAGIQPLDNKRWKFVLHSRLDNAKKRQLEIKYIKLFFEIIHEYALEIENKLINKEKI